MKAANARILSNDFQAVRLCRLATWRGPSAVAPEGGRGPYVILQTGIDPEDPTATVEDFILGAGGRWLPLYLFYRLPQEVRREQFVFSTVADAIAVLRRLTGKARVDHPRREGMASATGEDDLNRAVADAEEESEALPRR